MRAAVLLALAAAVASGSARGGVAPDQPGANTVSELVVTAAKTVSELTVTAPAKCLPPVGTEERAQRPHLVASFPARGAAVRPGLVVIRLTFDQPVACEGRLEDALSLPNPCPGKVQHMLLSLDRRTVRTVCLIAPGRDYGFSIGTDPTSNTFVGLGGLPALPAKIAFTASAEAPLTDVCEALAEDPETAADLRRRGKLPCHAGS